MKDRRAMLRVKVMSLAEESKIIRKEERRNKEPLREELASHRRNVVRWHARASHMAYGLVKGVPLDRIEKPGSSRDERFWKEVRRMVMEYGPFAPDVKKQLAESCHD